MLWCYEIGKAIHRVLDIRSENVAAWASSSLAQYNDCSVIDLGTDCNYLALVRVSQRRELA